MSNGDFLFTTLKQADVNEINEQLNGVSCILYHNGLYEQAVKYRFKVVASKFVVNNFCIEENFYLVSLHHFSASVLKFAEASESFLLKILSFYI